jgi:hypothetical protein
MKRMGYTFSKVDDELWFDDLPQYFKINNIAENTLLCDILDDNNVYVMDDPDNIFNYIKKTIQDEINC